MRTPTHSQNWLLQAISGCKEPYYKLFEVYKHYVCIKSLAVICTLVLVFFSCNKGEFVTEAPLTPSLTSNDVSYFVKDGIIHFNNDTAFANTIERLSELNDSDFNLWENKIGFKSLKSELESVYDEMDSCKSEVEFEALIQKNLDILVCKDSTLFPRIESDIYSKFVNREGYYYIVPAHKL